MLFGFQRFFEDILIAMKEFQSKLGPIELKVFSDMSIRLENVLAHSSFTYLPFGGKLDHYLRRGFELLQFVVKLDSTMQKYRFGCFSVLV